MHCVRYLTWSAQPCPHVRERHDGQVVPVWSRSDGPWAEAQGGVEVLEVLVVVGEDAPVVVH